MQTQIQKLIKNSKNPDKVREAFEFAKEIYKDRKWLSGKDLYIDHVLRMAITLKELGIDETTIMASFLYGVADTSLFSPQEINIEEIEKRFGKEVAYLVKKSSDLNKTYYSFNISRGKYDKFGKEKMENIKNMFFAMAKDLRVVLLKIASRLDGLKRIEFISNETRRLYSIETLYIFVPIANRLGLGEIRTQLEDLAFANIYPEDFKWIEENIKEKYEERKKYLENFMPKLRKLLKKEGISFLDIGYRAKSYWSTYQKLQRHQMDFEKIYDLVALRIIVKDISSCYKLLGIIHKNFQPMSGQIQDYIAKPKENGYKSLHTTVFLDENEISEIQIKTDQLHKDAEHGICAHWAYKEKISIHKEEENLKFAKELPEFWKSFKIDFFDNKVFTFTPKGDVIVLPKGSTSVDFAYAIHSEVGNHCEGAKIDGKIIPLSRPLSNGDIVEIITSKKKQPSLDWLRFVKTSFARSHINKIISATFSPIFSVPTFIGKKIIGIVKKPQKEVKTQKKLKTTEVYIGKQKGISYSLAKCCLPKAGDNINAYIGKTGSAVLHSTSCKNFKEISKKFPEKIVSATWHES